MKRNRKFQPAFLFISASVLLLLSGVIFRDRTFDIQLHDTYFVTGYFGLAIILSAGSALAALVYYGLERFRRPVKLKTGFWHFGLFAAGLFSGAVAFYVQMPDPATEGLAVFLVTCSGVFFLLSAVVFLYGLTRAVLKPAHRNRESEGLN